MQFLSRVLGAMTCLLFSTILWADFYARLPTSTPVPRSPVSTPPDGATIWL